MDVVGVLGKGAKLYFWLLVTAGIGIAVYLGVRVVAGRVGDTIGWVAFVGIVVVLVVLLGAIRMAMRRTTQGI